MRKKDYSKVESGELSHKDNPSTSNNDTPKERVLSEFDCMMKMALNFNPRLFNKRTQSKK